MKRTIAAVLLLLLVLAAVMIATVSRPGREPVRPDSTSPEEDSSQAPPPLNGAAAAVTGAETAAADVPPSPDDPVWIPAPNGSPLAGHVVAENGRPVADAEIELGRMTADGWIHPPILRAGADGAFRIEGLPEGRYHVWVRARLYAGASLPDVPAGLKIRCSAWTSATPVLVTTFSGTTPSLASNLPSTCKLRVRMIRII